MKRFSITTDEGRSFNVKARKSYLFGNHVGWEFSFHDVSILNKHVITLPYTRKETDEIQLHTIRQFDEYLQTVALRLANDLERRELFAEIKPDKSV